jgi:hypothetical protein
MVVIVLAVLMVGILVGMVIISLLFLAQTDEEVKERLEIGQKLPSVPDDYHRSAALFPPHFCHLTTDSKRPVSGSLTTTAGPRIAT